MRLRWRLALAAFILLVVGAVSAGVWLARFEPLARSNGVGLGYDPGFVPQKPVPHLGFGLSNDGRVGVTVTRIETPGPTVPLMAPFEVDPFAEGMFAPFEEFGLGAGETRWIALGSSLPMCVDAEPDGAALAGEVRVRYEVFGIPRSTTIDLSDRTDRFVTEEAGQACIQMERS
jgi:hypothetical protein